MESSKKRHLTIVLGALGIVAVMAAGQLANQPEQPATQSQPKFQPQTATPSPAPQVVAVTAKPSPVVAPPAQAPGMAGLVAYRDPATGKMAPPPAGFLQTLAPDSMPDISSNLSSEGLVEEVAPGGGVMVRLNGRFRHFATVSLDANGNLTGDCTTTPSVTGTTTAGAAADPRAGWIKNQETTNSTTR